MAKLTGKQLARDNGLTFAHVLYRKTGDWYHVINEYPAALMDDTGYVPFLTLDDYARFITESTNASVKENRSTKTLIVKGGISLQPGYILFGEEATFPEQAVPKGTWEGASQKVLVNRYERDRQARNRCIKHWGATCAVCGFNFADAFGAMGEGFIHVHHLTPLASIGQEYELAPEEDLRPVCPNCHAMLHRRTPPYTIEELRKVRADTAV